MSDKLIPADWLTPNILERRIICHWTVTSYVPDEASLDSYHIVIDGKGKPHAGRPLNRQAPHTWHYNSAIGISLACMSGYRSPSEPGPYPPKKEQWEALISIVRQLADHYQVPVEPSTILMHGEVYPILHVYQDGKWDIGWLPHLKLYGERVCGDELRRRIAGQQDDNLRVKVGVKVHKDNTRLEGLLFDASTLIPIRAFCEKVPGLSISAVNNSATVKTVTLDYKSGELQTTFTKKLSILDETGYVSLSSVCESIGWGTSVDTWTADQRLVSVAPRGE